MMRQRRQAVSDLRVGFIDAILGRMSPFDAAAYGPVFARCLPANRCRALDAGEGVVAAADVRSLLTVEKAFAHAEVRDGDSACCCLAAAWLLCDALAASHEISQSVETPAGSFWHGVMHRREGDFGNAKYWFRRARKLTALAPLDVAANELAAEVNDDSIAALARQIAPQGGFDPFAFVDACQLALRTGGAAEAFCRQVQQAEWEILFDACYKQAVA